MRIPLKCSFFIAFLLTMMTTSCASIKTVNVWKDETSNERLQKVLVIAAAQVDFMQEHFENVLSERLASRGVEAVPGNKVFSQSGAKLEREAILAKVRELGIRNVLVARPISKEETSQLYPGGIYTVPLDYRDGWFRFYSYEPGSAYDAEFFTIVTNVYEVKGEKLIWSYLSRVKVENSREGAINPFIDVLMKQLQESKLL